MWQEWLYKTIIAFISINGLEFVFAPFLKVWDKKEDGIKKTTKIRAFINSLIVSMIPFIRWLFVGMILFLVIMAPIYKEELKKEGKKDE